MCERISLRCLPSGSNDGIRNCEAVKVNKSSNKSWSNFIQWLRHKRVTEAKWFKSESDWKWQYDNQADKCCVKRDDNEYDEH